MWIFAQKGFLSIVKHREKPGYLLVRARAREDIHEYFPKATVEVDSGTDYKYRTVLPAIYVASRITDAIDAIDYDNFKNNIKDKRRTIYYSVIWRITAEMQDAFSREGKPTQD